LAQQVRRSANRLPRPSRPSQNACRRDIRAHGPSCIIIRPSRVWAESAIGIRSIWKTKPSEQRMNRTFLCQSEGRNRLFNDLACRKHLRVYKQIESGLRAALDSVFVRRQSEKIYSVKLLLRKWRNKIFILPKFFDDRSKFATRSS
jgi:hypothetical protein